MDEKKYTMREAASILNKSYEWVNKKRAEGLIEADFFTPLCGKKHYVLTEKELERIKKELEK